MDRKALKGLFDTPAPPPIHRKQRDALKAKWAQELQKHGLPPDLATAAANAAIYRADLEATKARWTGRCALTGVPFTSSPAVMRADGEFVLAVVAQLQGQLSDARFIQLCRLVAAHCGAPAAPPPPTQPATTPLSRPAPTRIQHADEFDFGTALGVHRQGERTKEFDDPDDSTGPADQRGGVWAWDPQLGRAVCSAG